jgi:hypothetical protein
MPGKLVLQTDAADRNGTTGRNLASEARKMKLAPTCRACIKSLNRSGMKSRSFLSWITGYSAFSSALGLLYWLALILTEQQQQPSLEEGSVMDSTSRSSGPSTLTSGSGSASTERDPETEVADANASISIALDVLGVVCRQFPAMQKYRDVIIRLRSMMLHEDGSSRSADASRSGGTTGRACSSASVLSPPSAPWTGQSVPLIVQPEDVGPHVEPGNTKLLAEKTVRVWLGGE